MDVKKKILICAIAVLVPVVLMILLFKFGLLGGLSNNAVYALGILTTCIILWVTKVFPEAITAIVMCILYIVVCDVPTQTVFSTFASSTWWLLLAAFTIGYGMQKTGLMKRMANRILKAFPNTFSMQAVGLIASGTLIGPFIPSLAAKVSLLAPLSMQIATNMGYKMKTRPAEGLFLAMYTGARNVGPIVVSASITGYALMATLPENIVAKFDLLTWALYMLPWFIVVSILNLIAIVALYKPKGEPIFIARNRKAEHNDDGAGINADAVNTDVIHTDVVHTDVTHDDSVTSIKKHTDKTEINKMTPAEKKLSVIVMLCVILWITEPLHQIGAHVVALMAMVAMVALNVVSIKDVKSNLAWDSLIFIGCVLGIASVFSYLGIDQWIIAECYPLFNDLASNYYLLIVGLAVVTVALRFVIVSDVAFINIFMAFLVSLSLTAGINPWIVGVTIYAMSNPWFALYQNPIYLAAYYAVDAKMVRQKSMALYCVIYSVICLIGLLASIPFWQATGVMTFIGG